MYDQEMYFIYQQIFEINPEDVTLHPDWNIGQAVTNGNDIAVITESYREARVIVGCFAVNIFAELFPISCVG